MTSESQQVWPGDGTDLLFAMEQSCSRQCTDPSLHAELQKHLSAPSHTWLAVLDGILLNR